MSEMIDNKFAYKQGHNMADLQTNQEKEIQRLRQWSKMYTLKIKGRSLVAADTSFAYVIVLFCTNSKVHVFEVCSAMQVYNTAAKKIHRRSKKIVENSLVFHFSPYQGRWNIFLGKPTVAFLFLKAIQKLWLKKRPTVHGKGPPP